MPKHKMQKKLLIKWNSSTRKFNFLVIFRLTDLKQRKDKMQYFYCTYVFLSGNKKI